MEMMKINRGLCWLVWVNQQMFKGFLRGGTWKFWDPSIWELGGRRHYNVLSGIIWQTVSLWEVIHLCSISKRICGRRMWGKLILKKTMMAYWEGLERSNPSSSLHPFVPWSYLCCWFGLDTDVGCYIIGEGIA